MVGAEPHTAREATNRLEVVPKCDGLAHRAEFMVEPESKANRAGSRTDDQPEKEDEERPARIPDQCDEGADGQPRETPKASSRGYGGRGDGRRRTGRRIRLDAMHDGIQKRGIGRSELVSMRVSYHAAAEVG